MNFVTLFSGGELFGVGARAAGLSHLFGIEKNERIAKIARLNGFNVLALDILDVFFDEFYLGDLFLLHASPPCQMASLASGRGGMETVEDSRLSLQVQRAINAFMPKFFTLENVVNYRNFDAFDGIVRRLESLGYSLAIKSVNMADYGVPQTRRRLILVAARDGAASFPIPTHCKYQHFFRSKWVGWHEALGGYKLPSSSLSTAQFKRLIKQGFDPDSRVTFVADTRNTNRKNTIRFVHEPFFTVTATIRKGHAKGKLPSGRWFRMNERAYAIMQTLPKAYQLGDLKGIAQRIIGNGVPCRFAEVLCKHLIERDLTWPVVRPQWRHRKVGETLRNNSVMSAWSTL